MMSVRLFLLVSSTFCPNLTAAPPVTSFKPAPRPTPTVSFDWRQSKLLQTYSVSTKDNTHSSAVPVPVSVSDPQCPKHLLVLSHLRVHTSLRCLIQPTSSCFTFKSCSAKRLRFPSAPPWSQLPGEHGRGVYFLMCENFLLGPTFSVISSFVEQSVCHYTHCLGFNSALPSFCPLRTSNYPWPLFHPLSLYRWTLFKI